MAGSATRRRPRAVPPPTMAEVDAAVESLRARLVTQPMLLLHDAELPSVTTAIAGEPIAGSWWGHRSGKLVFEVLSRIEDEVAWPKLVRGKVTLLHRDGWPLLIAAARDDEPWQLAGLPGEGRRLLEQVRSAGHVRTDRLRESGDGRAIGKGVDQLERRLLVMSEQVHTAAGKHARELSTWERWALRVGLGGAALPTAAAARAQLEAMTSGWVDDPGSLFPWREAAR
jgi:hypothetical protein